ncbi:MAG: aldo/keto reductase family protein [Thermomicrobiales bacterium]
MVSQPTMHPGIDHHPPIIYGTAWKEERTQPLVELSLRVGFRGIDTANQWKHYHEAAVGSAIANAVTAGLVRRDELFLQTKFTFRSGQDHRLPYDPAAPIGKQVEQSFASSLEHLETDNIDSYLLHGPSTRVGLTDADWEAWEAIEAIHDSGRARAIGVSNVNVGQLQLLLDQARVRPRIVQNRCYASQGWDRAVRELCSAHHIVYQGFSLLTANRTVLAHPDVVRIAQRLACSVPQLVFRFAMNIGIMPLTGTTSENHMRDDMAAQHLYLGGDVVSMLEGIGE